MGAFAAYIVECYVGAWWMFVLVSSARLAVDANGRLVSDRLYLDGCRLWCAGVRSCCCGGRFASFHFKALGVSKRFCFDYRFAQLVQVLAYLHLVNCYIIHDIFSTLDLIVLYGVLWS